MISVVGHRGIAAREPENTIRSFTQAVHYNVEAIELDLRLTRDGHVVVMHDAAVDRTTNGTGEVAELTFAEIRALDAGNGERVPTFDEVLAAVDVQVQTEIKAAGVVEELARQGYDFGERVTLTSFHPEFLATAIRLFPGVPRGLITGRPSLDWVRLAHELGARWFCARLDSLTEELVQASHEADLLVDAWPINSESELAQAIAVGADTITTDNAHLVPDWETSLSAR